MSQCHSTPFRGSISVPSLCVGIAGVPEKTAAAFCGEAPEPVSVGYYDRGLVPSVPDAMLNTVHTAIENAITVSKTPIGYSDIRCVLLSLPGDVEEFYASALAFELTSIEPRLAGKTIFVVSDLEAEMHRISRGGSGLIVNSGLPDVCVGVNAAGDSDWKAGGGFVEKLIWKAINSIATACRGGEVFTDLEQRFLDHFHVSSRLELEGILGFFDPMERILINDEILSIFGKASVAGNKVADEWCKEICRQYVDFVRPVISNLRLEREEFPVSTRGGVFWVDPIYKRFFESALKAFAPKAHVVEEPKEMGVAEARMAFDLLRL